MVHMSATSFRDIIPANRLSTVAVNVAISGRFRTRPGNPLTHVNNYSTVGGGGTNEHQVVSKLDHNLNTKWKFFGTFSRIWADQFNLDPLGYSVNLTRQSTYTPNAHNSVIDRGIQSRSDWRVSQRLCAL